MSILEEAKAMRETIVRHRRTIHENAEVHLDLPKTSGYVEEALREMGYEPQRLGSSGVVALAGGQQPGKTFLLRADMDALPIEEENDLPFKSRTGNMHACGHDLHTAMLLGAAQILKNHEAELPGTVKFMFQPAEETMSGAKMMVEADLLENPNVDAALMIHVASGAPFPTGSIVCSEAGVNAAACDWFTINVRGKGCHGATPHIGVDPLNVLSHIHIALQAINAREVAPTQSAVVTVGQMHGGNTSNVIPDTAYMSGTIRAMNEQMRAMLKQRMQEIAAGVAATFGATAEVCFDRGCPCNMVDDTVNRQVKSYLEEMLGEEKVLDAEQMKKAGNGMGSEDFAYVSNARPSTMIMLSAGAPDEGYCAPMHSPKVMFNEDALPVGAAVYAQAALEWLKHNS